MRHLSIGIIVGLVIACIVAINANLLNAQSSGPANPVASSPESIAAGKTSYTSLCQSCHGPGGKGDGPIVASLPTGAPKPADLTDNQWDHGSTDGQIFTVIKDGLASNAMMRPFANRMSDTEIWNVVNFIRSLAQN